MKIGTIGIDLAKQVFAIHGVDGEGRTVLRKTLRRSQVVPFFTRLEPCLIGTEACSSAHYWGRELTKLGQELVSSTT
jgi:transposase